MKLWPIRAKAWILGSVSHLKRKKNNTEIRRHTCISLKLKGACALTKVLYPPLGSCVLKWRKSFVIDWIFLSPDPYAETLTFSYGSVWRCDLWEVIRWGHESGAPWWNAPRHIGIKLTKIKDRDEILKATREKEITKGNSIGYQLISQQKLHRPERNGTIYFEWWKGRTYNQETLPSETLDQIWWRN